MPTLSARLPLRGYRCAADLPACRPKNVASATPARALEDNDVGPGPPFVLYGPPFVLYGAMF